MVGSIKGHILHREKPVTERIHFNQHIIFESYILEFYFSANLRPERPLQTISQQRPVRKSEIRHSALSDREAHIYNYISGDFKLPSNCK